jgi:hypothetical protein
VIVAVSTKILPVLLIQSVAFKLKLSIHTLYCTCPLDKPSDLLKSFPVLVVVRPKLYHFRVCAINSTDMF